MKEIQFSIKETIIHERVKTESGFTAQIKATAGQTPQLSSLTIATDEEARIMNGYIPSAINECIIAINRYLSPCNVTEENEGKEHKKYCFNILIPHNYPEELVESLENIVTDFISNRCLQQWYMLVKSDDANTSAMKAQSSMTLLRETLSVRKKPE